VAIEPFLDIDQVFAQGTPIDEALNDAVRDAVRQHKRMDLPLAVWRDGKTVWLLPEDLTTENDSNDLEPS
jgi:hypothetical protein